MEDTALFFGVLGAFVAFLDEHGAESWKEAETMASSGCRVHAGATSRIRLLPGLREAHARV